MADASIEFKGSSFTLSVLYLKTSDLTVIRADLAKKIAQAPDFFYLVPIVVNIERLDDYSTDSSIDYQAVKTLVEAFKFTFVGFTGSLPKEQRQLIRELGFSFVNTAKKDSSPKQAVAKVVTERVVTEKAKGQVVVPQQALYTDKIHRGQIRSGQQVYAKDQNLVVIGSVSAGAEVIADGNIHVYGSLRGRAIAGAKGHHHAQIYCQNLEAELVSINGSYWLSESMEQHWSSPVYIHLTDNELMSSKLI
ncbi:MAG: septum site-determining protein MinC [Colwellia sp.]|nr:septum site-determining protein MinC [Colwellia sp.]